LSGARWYAVPATASGRNLIGAWILGGPYYGILLKSSDEGGNGAGDYFVRLDTRETAFKPYMRIYYNP
jgi:hypothetical protein